MDDLVVNSKFTASIVDDQYTDTATAIGEGFIESRPQSTLINNRKTLLHIASLGHGNNATVIADVKDAVLLKNGAEHVLHDD